MIIEKYSSWNITNRVATSEITVDSIGTLKVKADVHLRDISSEGGARYEGWWPQSMDEKKRTVAIAGNCLWDGRWAVQFKKIERGNNGARRSLALPYGRKDVGERIIKGQQIEEIRYPIHPSLYHRNLIEWQGRKFESLMPEKILYHLPASEYHCFIRTIENITGKHLEKLHLELDVFVSHIRHMIETSFGDLMEVVTFIDPMSWGVVEPEQSFLWPYLNSEMLGISASDIYGVEDLAELKLAVTALHKNGHCIPVMCCVPTIPDIYMERSEVDTKAINFCGPCSAVTSQEKPVALATIIITIAVVTVASINIAGKSLRVSDL